MYLTAKNDIGKDIIIVVIAERNETFKDVKIVAKLKATTSPYIIPLISHVNNPIIGINAPIIGANKTKKNTIHFLLSN